MDPTRRKEARPAGTASTARRCVLASLAVHVVAVIVLSLPVVRPERPVFADPLYQVALVEWPEPNAVPPVHAVRPPSPTTSPEPRTPPRATVVETRKKPTPRKDPARKPAPATPAETAAPPAATPQVQTGPPAPGPVSPQAASGPVSLGMVDQRDFQHNYYLELVRSLISREWTPPSGSATPLRAGLHFVIRRDGTIETPEVTTSSGWSAYDRAALRAVFAVKRLPPLPEAYGGGHLGLTVFFQHTGSTP
jgi:TonB family protein